KAGLAGAIRADGVAARSATTSDEAGCIWAVSTCTASAAGPASPRHVAEGSLTKPAADADETDQTAASRIAVPMRASIICLTRFGCRPASIEIAASPFVNRHTALQGLHRWSA